MNRFYLFIIVFLIQTSLYCQYYHGSIQFKGSFANDEIYAITSDNKLNTYVTGIFTDTLITSDPFLPKLGSHGLKDIFISKVDRLSQILWLKRIGGIGNQEISHDIETDNEGNIIISGHFSGTLDFDPDTTVHQISARGQYLNSFILKLDAQGHFVWVKTFDFNISKSNHNLSIDSRDNIYFSGNFSGTKDFDPDTSNHLLSAKGGKDVFLMKLNKAGKLSWVKHLEGLDDGLGISTTMFRNKEIVYMGRFKGLFDLDPDTSKLLHRSSNAWSMFISKIDTSGTFQWAKVIGDGVQPLIGESIISNGANNLYLAGIFGGIQDFNMDTTLLFQMFATTPNGDIFINKMDSDGNFHWAKQIQSKTFAKVSSLAIDSYDNLYISGRYTDSTDFDPGPRQIFAPTNNITNRAGYVAKYDPNGNLNWVLGRGSLGIETKAITINEVDQLYVSGIYGGRIDLDPGIGTNIQHALIPYDTFLSKFVQLGIITSYNQSTFIQNKNNIYPNPTKGNLNIQLDQYYQNINLRILDINSRIVNDYHWNNSNLLNYHIEGPSGLYTLELQLNDEDPKYYKVIKQ